MHLVNMLKPQFRREYAAGACAAEYSCPGGQVSNMHDVDLSLTSREYPARAVRWKYPMRQKEGSIKPINKPSYSHQIPVNISFYLL